jgi:hypothetical protein
MNEPIKTRRVLQNWPFLAGILIVIVYFCYFVLPSLNGGFRNDDALNIYYYWSRGPKALLQAIVLFWTPYYRPMAGIYFYSIYEIFGLNPFPYHAVIVLLLFLNVILAYRCATILSGSRIAGGLCSILIAYHANMALLAYVPAFIFDVICFTLYFAALVYYLRIRCSGRTLNMRQILFLLLIYIFALESKEMAVSLPAMIMVYEVLWHAPERSAKSVLIWLRTGALPALVTGFLTVVFIIGKSTGPEALSKNPAYHITVSLRQFFETNLRYAREYFYLENIHWFSMLGFGIPLLISVWIILAYIGLSRRKNHLTFSFAMIVIAALPIAFLPDRAGAVTYIPSFGWALITASLIEGTCNFLSRHPFLRFMKINSAKALLLLLAVGFIGLVTYYRNRYLIYSLTHQDREFRLVKEQLEKLLPSVKPGTRIAFYNDIFRDWDAKFIAGLLYKDRSVSVRLNEKAPLKSAEWDKMDYVLAFEQEKLVILKRPGEILNLPP